MNAETSLSKGNLERYSFMWSLARMGIGALSLFFGATPILYTFVGGSVMSVAWLISGVASIYLGYQWYQGGRTLFGTKKTQDTVAFLLMVLTGINLGYAAIGGNISMMFTYSVVSASVASLVFKATALAYLGAGYYLYTRWKASAERMF